MKNKFELVPQIQENNINIHFKLSGNDFDSISFGNIISDPNKMIYFRDLKINPPDDLYHSWCVARYCCTNSLIFPLLGYISSNPKQLIFSSLSIWNDHLFTFNK